MLHPPTPSPTPSTGSSHRELSEAGFSPGREQLKKKKKNFISADAQMGSYGQGTVQNSCPAQSTE